MSALAYQTLHELRLGRSQTGTRMPTDYVPRKVKESRRDSQERRHGEAERCEQCRERQNPSQVT